jgi:hypothetical protein
MLSNLWGAAVLGLALFALAACSGEPSHGDVTGQVKQQLMAEQKAGRMPLAEIDGITQTNGYMKDKTHYVADITYTLTFTESMGDYADRARKAAGDANSLGGALSDALKSLSTGVTYGDFKRGQTITVKTKKTFLKTDNGWVLQ